MTDYEADNTPEKFLAVDREKDKTTFLSLWVPNQSRVFGYIYTMVPRRSDAEDILQETCMTLWEKFEDFELGTEFIAWACRVAYWKVRHYQTNLGRSKITFSQSVIESLAETINCQIPELDSHRIALEKCLRLLNQKDRTFILNRYEPDGSVASAAALSGRKKQAAYKALSRIRRALFHCINQSLDAEESS